MARLLQAQRRQCRTYQLAFKKGCNESTVLTPFAFPRRSLVYYYVVQL